MILGVLYKDSLSLANITEKSVEFMSHIAGTPSLTLIALTMLPEIRVHLNYAETGCNA